MKLIIKTYVIQRKMCTPRQKKLCGDEDCEICFERSFMSYDGLTKSGKKKVDCWNYEKNDIGPDRITKGSHKKFWFNCDVCEHEFESILKDVASNKKPTWCPYCSVPTKRICFLSDCNHCYTKTFQSYMEKTSKGKLKIECWSEKNSLSPREVLKGNDSKFWFVCDVCEHEFDASPDKITGELGRWCPYCCIPVKKLCNKEDCVICFKKTFLSYAGKTKNGKKKVDCWNYEKNDLDPIEVTLSSSNKYWFICDVCEHNFKSSPSKITSMNEKWCPYCCVNNKKLCVDPECNFCKPRRFSSYMGMTSRGKFKKDCFDMIKNRTDIHNISISNKDLYWFICDVCGGSFKQCTNCITSSKPKWCPFCKNKTEGKFKHYFENKYPEYKLKYQPKWDWCKSEKDNCLPFDFAIKKLKIIIEIDGEQHFSQVSNWCSPEDNLKNDIFKMKMANENGYTVIRILQDDIYCDKNDWENKLDKILKKHDQPTVYYIGCDVKYGKHMEC